MRFAFELQICIFDLKTSGPAYAVQICKIRPDFLRFENPITQVAKFRRLGSSDFQSKNGRLSEFKMLSTTANSSRTIDELDGDTDV